MSLIRSFFMLAIVTIASTGVAEPIEIPEMPVQALKAAPLDGVRLDGYLAGRHRKNADYLLYLLNETHPWREHIRVGRNPIDDKLIAALEKGEKLSGGQIKNLYFSRALPRKLFEPLGQIKRRGKLSDEQVATFNEKVTVDEKLIERVKRRREAIDADIAAKKKADAAIRAKTGRAFMLDAFRERGGPRIRPWDGEYAGKWIDAATLEVVNLDHDRLRRALEEFVVELREHQEPDGYFGMEVEGQRGSAWDMWNHWYIVTGMMSRYEYMGDRKAFDTARQVGQYIVERYAPPDPKKNILRGAWGGGCTVDVLGQLMRLWRHTRDDGYLKIGRYISENYGPIQKMRETGKIHYTHAYVLTAYLGGMVLYNQARNAPGDLAWIEKVWDHLVDEQVYPSASIGRGERLHPPRGNRPAIYDKVNMNIQETCATVEWLLMNHRLYEATGRIRYAHMIENIVYNALLAAQSADGMKWNYHTSLSRTGGKPWMSHGGTMCCFWSGPRGVARIPLYAMHLDDDGVRIDLLEKSRATVPVNGTDVTIDVDSEYPASGRMTIDVNPARPERFALKVRIPEWAENVSVQLGGDDVPAVAGEYAVIERRWVGADKMTVYFDLPVRMQTMPGGEVAILRGPELLSADERDNPELDFASVKVESIKGCKAMEPTDDGRRRYRVTVMADDVARDMVMTPYAAAGNEGAAYRSTFGGE